MMGSRSLRSLRAGLSHPVLVSWQDTQVGSISPNNLVYPIFVKANSRTVDPIEGFPGQFTIGIECLKDFLSPIVSHGLKAVLLFGSVDPETKDVSGHISCTENNPVVRAIRIIRLSFPEVLVICDVCLCDYTSTGMCGIADKDGKLKEPESLDAILRCVECYAQAGCHLVSPSDMMDGRVAAISQLLKDLKLDNQVAIMNYGVKFASSMYEPFRKACGISGKNIDRSTHQLPIKGRSLAKRCAARDVESGVDFIIVKPCMGYLDIVRDLRETDPMVPLAVYQVSGEYCMFKYAAENKVLDEKKAVMEFLNCATRAGANIIITYYTPQILQWIRNKSD